MIIYGKNPVWEYITSNHPIKEVWIEKAFSDKYKNIISLCNEKNISYSLKKKSELNKLTQKKHQGLIAKIYNKTLTFNSLKEFFNKSNSSPPYIFILLDSITDPRNLGAILRSCDHFNITAVITAKDRSAPITPIVYKTSSGAVNHINYIKVTNLSRTIDSLKKMNTWVYGMDEKGDYNLYDCQFKGNIAIVIGSEGKGIRPLIKKSCDFLVKIKGLGHISSLNASVASGIIMYEVTKQRNNDKNN